MTSIDQEGTRKGFDNDLISAVADVVEVPVIACGGYGANEHPQQAINAGADAVGFADTLHYNHSTFADLRQVASDFRFGEALNMSTDVTIVDYGIGNLFSARRAFEHCGAAKVSVTSNEEEIRNASFLVLPGVGAFRKGIEGLAEMNLIGAVKDYAASGRPLLGICLGMQLFATEL